LDDTTLRDLSSRPQPHAEAARDRARRIGDVRQWLGMNGDGTGTSGVLRRTFLYAYLFAAVMVGVVNTINVLTLWHDEPGHRLLRPIIEEGSSWLSLLAFYWVAWIAYRLAPPTVRPRWMLLIHIPGDALFSFGHVAGFIALRKLAAWALGGHYDFGPFLPNFIYELGKDSLGYLLFQTTFAALEYLLRQQQALKAPTPSSTFDIRDGAKVTRVRLDDVLAVSSAGNYVEFVTRDGRRLLMRSSLSALEAELSPRGFLRTHRSWLINTARMTALTPEGSGDYSIEVESVTVPLSRRYPEALAKLRGA
jgi:hypothetical protein